MPREDTSFPYVRQRRVLALGTTLAVGVLIGYFTLTPVNMPQGMPVSDKFWHVVAFAALTFPAALIYRRACRWVAPLALLYGVVIELIQPHVGRSGELADVYADAFGALLGLALGMIFNEYLIRPAARRRLARDT
ncbi:VanZ family protein [Roseobacter ponti]|uniref:VanZ family protein n=1 Tax=Roseobacter ponti TaxID=1891787 RepID=A0A858SSH8_9RHOB|nr:VanZ family protein [Roseobacter ponti]QJF51869.1 VanZ family protein [Roseobacter ponti]